MEIVLLILSFLNMFRSLNRPLYLRLYFAWVIIKYFYEITTYYNF